jgi:hypothetical protein
MIGHLSGVSTRITKEAPKAIFVHCLAHELQLSLEEVASLLPEIADYLNQIQHVSVFIGASSKRHFIFEKIQKEAGAEVEHSNF